MYAEAWVQVCLFQSGKNYYSGWGGGLAWFKRNSIRFLENIPSTSGIISNTRSFDLIKTKYIFSFLPMFIQLLLGFSRISRKSARGGTGSVTACWSRGLCHHYSGWKSLQNHILTMNLQSGETCGQFAHNWQVNTGEAIQGPYHISKHFMILRQQNQSCHSIPECMGGSS